MLNFVPNQIPRAICVIGCGGTGSRLVPMLAQFIRSIMNKTNPLGWLNNPCIYLIDDDTVEHKNLLRQNFIDRDVGRNKAVVLAERYQKAYGVNIIPVPKRVEPGANIFHLVNEFSLSEETSLSTNDNVMFIMCVDSVKARHSILDMISNFVNVRSLAHNDRPFVIDAGNENDYGQVRFFTFLVRAETQEVVTRYKNAKPEIDLVNTEVSSLLLPAKFYMEMVDAPSQGSCADLDQTLAINAAMATTIMGVVQCYYYRKPFKHNCVGISLSGDGYTLYNTYMNEVKNILVREDLSKKVLEDPNFHIPHWANRWISGSSSERDYPPLKKYLDENSKAVSKMNADQEKENRAEREKALNELKAVETTEKKYPHKRRVASTDEETGGDIPELVEITAARPSPREGIPPLEVIRR